MRQSTALALVTLLAALATALLVLPATAGKPESVTASSVTLNADCTVDVAITLNSKGRIPSYIVVHYWQKGTHNGDNYLSFRFPERGGTSAGRVQFTAAPSEFGNTYEVGYSAFARNGSILGSALIRTLDVGTCL